MCWLGVSSPYSNVSFLGAGISQASLGQAKVQTQKGRKAPEAGTEGRKKGTSLAAGLGGDYEVENPPHTRSMYVRGGPRRGGKGRVSVSPKGERQEEHSSVACTTGAPCSSACLRPKRPFPHIGVNFEAGLQNRAPQLFRLWTAQPSSLIISLVIIRGLGKGHET